VTFLEQRTVSRKTQHDGRLEISPAVAAQLAAFGDSLRVSSGGRSAEARTQSMACTCAKGEGSGHLHHFIEADLLRELEPGSDVSLALDDARANLVRIERV
jgi:hypothetical protein